MHRLPAIPIGSLSELFEVDGSCDKTWEVRVQMGTLPPKKLNSKKGWGERAQSSSISKANRQRDARNAREWEQWRPHEHRRFVSPSILGLSSGLDGSPCLRLSDLLCKRLRRLRPRTGHF